MDNNPRPRVESPDQWRTTPRPKDWPRRVKAVLARDGHRCTWVEQGGQRCCNTTELEVDHFGDADDHDLDMLRTLCSWHHGRRTGRQGGLASGAARRQRATRRAEQHPGLLRSGELNRRDPS